MDPITEFRLARSRPDFVYGLGIDDRAWSEAAERVCQPRTYESLSPEYVRGLKTPSPRSKDYILVDHALIDLFEKRGRARRMRRALRLVNPQHDSSYAAYCAAMFGVHQPNLRKDLFDVETSFAGRSAIELVELATEFVSGFQQSWLDVTGHELETRISDSGPLPPTIVLVGKPVADLSLFWNLRAASDVIYPAWIIPIPVESANDTEVFDKLRTWLLSFLEYGPRANHCLITSLTVEKDKCETFAASFRDFLAETAVEVVEFEPVRNRLPVVVPFEYETIWPATISGRQLTIIPPKPRAFPNLGHSRAWIIDIVKDVKTGRAVKELALHGSAVSVELLNGPCPPRLDRSLIFRAGIGMDSINLRCSESREVISLYLPTSAEVLEETLADHAIAPIHDEKRSSYGPVIKRFGGLHFAASDLSGQFGCILNSLIGEPKTVEQIKGCCKLGGKDIAGETYLERVEPVLNGLSERQKRVARRRFSEYAGDVRPQNLKLQTLLEH